MSIACTEPTEAAVREAAGFLAGGALVVVPTDTVYGIAADIRRDGAVRALYEAKGKGTTAPLQLLFGPDPSMLERYARLTGCASRLIESLGPGGWTIICPAREGWSSPALAGGTTVGIRMPAAPAVEALVRELGAPLAASSANRHGQPSPVTCAEAAAAVGAFCAMALDGGRAPAALDSTVIDCASDSPRILREGAIDRHRVARILGLSDIPVLRSVRP
jgi:L-threonylcarbamoyladenylate synthase